MKTSARLIVTGTAVLLLGSGLLLLVLDGGGAGLDGPGDEPGSGSAPQPSGEVGVGRPVLADDDDPAGLVAGSGDGSIGPEGPGASSDQQRQDVSSSTVSVRGQVTSLDGKPLEGAVVTVFEPIYKFGGKVIAEVRTDRDGRYDLRVPRQDKLKVQAYAEGFEMKRMPLRSGGGGHDLALRPAAPDDP